MSDTPKTLLEAVRYFADPKVCFAHTVDQSSKLLPYQIMERQRLRPSPTRAISQRESAFLLGEPVGDFMPEPCYAHGQYCECDACVLARGDNFQAVPDFEFPQTMRYDVPRKCQAEMCHIKEALKTRSRPAPVEPRMHRMPHGYSCECRRCRECEPAPWSVLAILVGASLVWAGGLLVVWSIVAR